MERRTRLASLVALLALVVAGRGVVAGPSLTEGMRTLVVTDVASDGEWPMQDGCAARTRATRTRFPAGELEVAWRFEAKAPIAGDPCVSGDRVYVGTVADDGGASWLDVLRLSDGKPVVGPRKHAHGRPVRPAAWRDVVVVPAADGGLEALRVAHDVGRLASLGTFAGEGDVAVVDGDVVVVAGDVVERRRPGAPEARWSARLVAPAASPPTVRHGTVYVVTSGPREGFVGTRSQLETFSFADGSPRGSELLGWDAQPDSRAESRVVAGERELFVLHPRGVALKDGSSASGLRLPVGGSTLGEAAPIALASVPVAWGPSALVAYRTSARDELVLARSDPARVKDPQPGAWHYVMLASTKVHLELLEGTAPWVVADGVADVPRGRFEVASGRVVTVRPTAREARLVPARETLLAVEGRALVAYRRPRAALAAAAAAAVGPRLPDTAAAPLTLPGGVLVTRDGTARAGDLAWDAASRALVLGKEKVAEADVGLVVDREGRLVHGPEPAFVVRHLPATVVARTRAEWLSLARKAVATRSAPTLRVAVDDLAARGGRPDDLLSLRKELARLEKPQGAPPKPVPAKIAEVEAARAALLATERGALERAVLALPEDTPLGYRGPLLRAVLAEQPTHAATAAWLRARLPAGFDPGAEVSPLDWLDLVEATAQTPLRVMERKPDGPGLSMEDRVYGSLRHQWRLDLVALRSERLLLLTPVARPSRIARSLSLGELVCATLDALFEVRADEAKSAEPLYVQLFESKDEYLAKSVGPGASRAEREAGRAWLAWTAGHYDLEAGLSRLYVPPGDDRFDGVLETLAHELTHHWLDQRMPIPAGEKRVRYAASSPCYFLEEGFATMVEELVFDLEARTFSTSNPRADSLDVVAHADRLLPWAQLLETSALGFERLSPEEVHEVPCRWTLGMHRTLSDVNLFYAQGAAVCHWMWNADGGKRRALLREWVRDLHRARLSKGEAMRRLGMTPAEVGAAVVAWARATSAPGK